MITPVQVRGVYEARQESVYNGKVWREEGVVTEACG